MRGLLYLLSYPGVCYTFALRVSCYATTFVTFLGVAGRSALTVTFAMTADHNLIWISHSTNAGSVNSQRLA